jgi:hypothetical protein
MKKDEMEGGAMTFPDGYTVEPERVVGRSVFGGSEVGFTPGPWRVDGNAIRGTEDRHTNGRLRNSVGVSSASYSDQVCTIHGSMELGTPQANARLIAAAPDLLAALQLIEDGTDDRYILGLAREALKKATEV